MLLSILAHHPESGDPRLLEWIKHQLDAIFGLGPLLVVIVLGLIVISIPTAILVVYVVQRRTFGKLGAGSSGKAQDQRRDFRQE